MHMLKSRSKLRSLRGACKDFPKAVLKLKTKVTDAEKPKFKVFFVTQAGDEERFPRLARSGVEDHTENHRNNKIKRVAVTIAK